MGSEMCIRDRHIMVLIDQTVRGKIGKKGEVVDSLVLNKEFIN